MTQQEMRKACVTEYVKAAAHEWRLAHSGRPDALQVCIEEDPRGFGREGRELVSSVPHPRMRGYFTNTYRFNFYALHMRNYRLQMELLAPCKDRATYFRSDGLGIWAI